jgi:hypothetical protein
MYSVMKIVLVLPSHLRSFVVILSCILSALSFSSCLRLCFLGAVSHEASGRRIREGLCVLVIPCVRHFIFMQLTAVDGRRALVVLPSDPELVDILAKNGVDISVSEGDQQGNYVALLGNLLFPLVAFAGLFFLFNRGGGGAPGGGMGGPMGPMDFSRNKSKFQEVPETGVTFADVAVSSSSSFCVGQAAI